MRQAVFTLHLFEEGDFPQDHRPARRTACRPGRLGSSQPLWGRWGVGVTLEALGSPISPASPPPTHPPPALPLLRSAVSHSSTPSTFKCTSAAANRRVFVRWREWITQSGVPPARPDRSLRTGSGCSAKITTLPRHPRPERKNKINNPQPTSLGSYSCCSHAATSSRVQNILVMHIL